MKQSVLQGGEERGSHGTVAAIVAGELLVSTAQRSSWMFHVKHPILATNVKLSELTECVQQWVNPSPGWGGDANSRQGMWESAVVCRGRDAMSAASGFRPEAEQLQKQRRCPRVRGRLYRVDRR